MARKGEPDSLAPRPEPSAGKIAATPARARRPEAEPKGDGAPPSTGGAEALARAREKLEFALTSSSAGVWDWDMKTGRLEWSRELFRLFGLDPDRDEASFDTWHRVLHPDDLKEAGDRIAAAVRDHSRLRNEYRVVLPGGEVRWIDALGVTQYAGDGTPMSMSGICLEVTGRKLAEEKMSRLHRRQEILLSTSEKLLVSPEPHKVIEELCRQVMEFLDCHVFFNFLVDDKAGKLRLNSCAGITAEEARRMECLDFGVSVSGTVALEGRRIVAEDIPGHPDPGTELVGSYGVLAYACHPLLVAGGKVIGTLSFGSRSRTRFSDDDLSLMKTFASQVASALERVRLLEFERRQREELEERVRERTASLRQAVNLAEAEHRRFQEALDLLPAYLVLLSPDYHVPFANRFFEDRFGRSEGRRCFEYLFGRNEPCHNCQSFKALETKAPHRWEWTGPDERIYEIYDFPFQDMDGSTKIMEVGLDITDHRWDERALVERTAEVQQLADQLRALAVDLTQAEQRERKRLSGILHDHIQQLLVAARMQLEWMKSDPDVERMHTAARGVDGIIQQALDASRSLTIELSPPVLHQAGLVGGLNWLASRMREKNQFNVTLYADNRAEPESEEMRLLLFECARELLFNALKHGGVSEAQVNLLRTPQGITLVVGDQGSGFHPETLSQRSADEAGFGLFSIQQRLEHLGGILEVDSAPGKGTVITISVPFDEQKHPVERRRAPARAGREEAAAGGKAALHRLLIVDDHKIMREGLVGLLRFEADIEVVGEAADGPQAIALADKLRPEIVIMDVNLGDMSGVEATRAILAGNPRIKVIGLSMYSDPDVAAAMHDAGAAAYLTKGGPSEDLIAAIRSCFA